MDIQIEHVLSVSSEDSKFTASKLLIGCPQLKILAILLSRFSRKKSFKSQIFFSRGQPILGPMENGASRNLAKIRRL